MRTSWFMLLLLFVSMASGAEPARAQEAQDSALVIAKRGAGAFTGQVFLDSAGTVHLNAGEYVEVLQRNFANYRELSATPDDPALKTGKFSAGDFSYGQNRFFEISIVAGQAQIKEITEADALCQVMSLKRVGSIDLNIDPIRHDWENKRFSCPAGQ